MVEMDVRGIVSHEVASAVAELEVAGTQEMNAEEQIGEVGRRRGTMESRCWQRSWIIFI
jgi:hypothetical protein